VPEKADDDFSLVDENIHRRRIAQDYKTLAGEVYGKRVLRHLYSICGQGSTSFKRNEPESTAFGEGRRWVWLQIEAALRWKPEQRAKVIEEEE